MDDNDREEERRSSALRRLGESGQKAVDTRDFECRSLPVTDLVKQMGR